MRRASGFNSMKRLTLAMIPRYIGKLNWLHMFAFLTRNAWTSSIFRPIICFIFLLAYPPLQPVSLKNWQFRNTVWRGWNAKLLPWTVQGYGRHSKWRCCAHKASRTRACEYPLCHSPRSISGQEARQWRRNYQLAGVISEFRSVLFPGFDWCFSWFRLVFFLVSIKIVNAILP